jgi:hypothetical protein
LNSYWPVNCICKRRKQKILLDISTGCISAPGAAIGDPLALHSCGARQPGHLRDWQAAWENPRQCGKACRGNQADSRLTRVNREAPSRCVAHTSKRVRSSA